MLLPSKIFVCEFITGGGLNGEQLPANLLNEGLLMRDALLRDINALGNWQIYSTHDARVEKSPLVSKSICIKTDDDVNAIWHDCMQQVDYVWLIAPETSNILYDLTKMAEACQKKIIGCGLSAIAITTSKHKTADFFGQVGCKIIPSFYMHEPWQDKVAGACVIKPDDGAGCEETYVFKDKNALLTFMQTRASWHQSHIVQPFVEGVPVSISVLAYGNNSHVLSCNLQCIDYANNQCRYLGGEVNGALQYWDALSKLAMKVQQALPSLQGYFGIDAIVNAEGVTLVEINPRLTTSYIKLSEALAFNPAALILNALTQDHFIMPEICKNRVSFNVKHA